MRGEAEYVYADFSGGVNLSAAPYLVGDNQARNALNVNSNSNSQLRKRNGFSTLASLTASPASFTGAPHSLGAAEVSGGDYVVAVGPISGPNDRFVAVSSAGTVTDLNGAMTPTANTRWSIVQASATSDTKGPVFAMNGVDAPQYWTGSLATNFTTWTAFSGTVPVTGRYLIYHSNRLWCSSATNPSRLSFSGFTGAAVDTGAWDANDYVDFHPADGQVITGIGTLGPYLLVFKEAKVFRVYDVVTGANSEIISGVGCHAHRSIVETPSGTFFLDEDGVYLTDGDKVTRVSDPVEGLIKDASAFPSFADAAGVLFDNSYWLSLSLDGTTNNRTLQYDLESEAWWVHDCASNEFATISTTTGERVYSANPNATNVQRAFHTEVFQDSAANYAGTSFWTGPHLVWGMPHKQKRVRQVRVDGSGEWTLGTSVDYLDDFAVDSGEIWVTTAGDAVLYAPSTSVGTTYAPSPSAATTYAPVSAAVTTRRYYTPCVGDACTFKITNNDSADFGIYSYLTAINFRKD